MCVIVTYHLTYRQAHQPRSQLALAGGSCTNAGFKAFDQGHLLIRLSAVSQPYRFYTAVKLCDNNLYSVLRTIGTFSSCMGLLTSRNGILKYSGYHGITRSKNNSQFANILQLQLTTSISCMFFLTFFLNTLSATS